MSVTVVDASPDAAIDTVQDLNKIGVEQMRNGQMKDALASFHAALALVSKAAPPNAASKKKVVGARAATLNNIGCLFKRSDQPEDALRCLLEARDLEIEVNGAASCSTMMNLSAVMVTVGSIDSALVVAKECVKHAEGDDYLYVVSLHNLAVTQQSSVDAGEKRHATTTMLRAFAEARKRLGEDHPTTNVIREKCGIARDAPAQHHGRQPLPPRVPGKKQGDGGGHQREFARQALRSLDFASSDNNSTFGTISNSNTVTVATTVTTVSQQQQQQQQEIRKSPPPLPADVTRGATFTTTAASPMPDQPSRPMEKDASATVPPEQTIVLTAVAAAAAAPSGTLVGQQQSQAAASPTLLSPQTAANPTPAPSASAAPAAGGGGDLPPMTRRGSRPQPVYQQIKDERLRLRKRASDAQTLIDGLPPVQTFTRFAPPTGTALPIPIHFADVRNELKIAREAQQNADAAQVWIERSSGNMPTDNASACRTMVAAPVMTKAQALAHKKQLTRNMEDLEEKRLLDRRAREEQLAMLERANAERKAFLRDQERHRAAVTIQRYFRNWWNTVGFNKSHAARGNTQQMKRSQSKASISVTAVARCACKWLDKTAGKRLIVRLAGRKTDFLRVIGSVSKIQRIWRVAIARSRLRKQNAKRAAGYRARLAFERQYLAASRIQSVFRMHAAKQLRFTLMGKKYAKYVTTLQRCWRGKMQKRMANGAKASKSFGRAMSAITIQKNWRGYRARVAAAVRSIQRKVLTMRNVERNSARRMQCAGRAFLARRRLAATRQRVALAQAANAAALVPRSSASSATSSVDGAHRKAARGGVAALSTLTTKYHLAILETASEASRIRELERDQHYIGVAVQAQADRVVRDFTHPDVTAVRAQRAAEDNRRTVEVLRLRRLRAAKLIQRFFRVWLKLRFDMRERTLPLTRAIYAEKASRRKAETRTREAAKERIHEACGDLALPVRTLRLGLEADLAALRQDQPRPEEEAFNTRDWKERKVAVREINDDQRAVRKEVATVRYQSPSRKFITAKEQRRLMQAQNGEGLAGSDAQSLAIDA